MSEPISELVRAYTAEIASLREQFETRDALISTLLYENTGLKCQVDEQNEHALALQQEVYHYLSALEEIREFAVAHHESQESCVWLHGLTIDIPAMCDMALPLPEPDETVGVSSDGSIPF